MTNWAAIEEDLAEMARYFTICANNAGTGSWGQQYFNKHIETLETLKALVQTVIAEEDDGK